MDKCTECDQEMTGKKVLGCPYDIIKANGVYYHRSRLDFDEKPGYCHDCNAPHGQVHHWGCNVERCPRCGYQLISCNCWTNEIIDLLVRKDIKDVDILPATDPVGFERRGK